MTSAASSPASRQNSIVSTEALAERCRGTRCAVPSSICATTGQIEPGRYLPSWPMNMMGQAQIIAPPRTANPMTKTPKIPVVGDM